MSDLVRSGRFWTAVVVLVKAILFTLLPDFPREIWAALDALLAVVIGVMAGQEAGAARQARRGAGGRDA